MLDNITNMNVEHQERSKLVSLLLERLKIGCFCDVGNDPEEQTSLEVIEMTISRFKNLGGFKDEQELDFLLMCCGLVEGLCELFITQHSSGHACSSLVDLINVVLASCHILDHLENSLKMQCYKFNAICTEKGLILCNENRHVSFAASKAIIGLLKAECVSSGNSLHVRQFCEKWTASSLNFDETLVNRISFMEHLLSAFKNFNIETVPSGSHSKCALIDVMPRSAEQLHEILGCSMFLSPVTIPTLIKSISSWHDDDAKLHSLHSILRLLTVVFEKPSAIKEYFLRDASSLIDLLTSQMPPLVWERTCNLLIDILDYQSTTSSEQSVSVQYKFALASQFLHLASDKLWANMPSSDGLHSFGGPLLGYEVALCSELNVRADKPLLQSFLLCNLACLATVSFLFSDGKKEVHDKSIAAIQVYIHTKIHQSTSGRTALDDAHCSCVPALQLYDDQDDDLIQALLYFLDISSCIKKQNLLEKSACGLWNPHFQFHTFLLIVNMDYEVLLDLLISEETCFLLYFLKYLKLIVNDWNFFSESHQLIQLYDLSLFDGEAKDFKRLNNLTSPEQSPKQTICHKAKKEINTEKLVDYELSSEDSEEGDEENLPNSVQHHSIDMKVDSSVEIVHASLQSQNTLLKTILVFNCLLSTIEKQLHKNLFPYNAKPIVKLLKAVISNYSEL